MNVILSHGSAAERGTLPSDHHSLSGFARRMDAVEVDAARQWSAVVVASVERYPSRSGWRRAEVHPPHEASRHIVHADLRVGILREAEVEGGLVGERVGSIRR